MTITYTGAARPLSTEDSTRGSGMMLRQIFAALRGGPKPKPTKAMYRLFWCLPEHQGGNYLLSVHSTEEAAEEAADAFGASLPGVMPMIEIVKEEVEV